MISIKHRFHGYNSLSYVYRQGSTVRNQVLALKFVENKRRDNYRLAVVVGKKIHKSAVMRNRIRRRIYEIVRRNAGRIDKPYDMVITVFSDHLIASSNKELEDMVVGLLDQVSKSNHSPR